MNIFFCLLFFCLSLCEGANYTCNDILLTKSGLYASDTSNYVIPFDSLWWKVSLANGTYIDATGPPGAGDLIDVDFSSSLCGNGQFMSAVDVAAGVNTPRYGLVNIVSTRLCPGVLRIEKGATFNCDELIIGSGMIFLLQGTLVCRNFVMKSGAMMQGSGTVQSVTATVDGDVIPGFLFLTSLGSPNACNDCAASWLPGFSGTPTVGVDYSLGTVIFFNTTQVTQMRAKIWISFSTSNPNNTNAVRFTVVQFQSPATVHLMPISRHLFPASLWTQLYLLLCWPQN